MYNESRTAAFFFILFVVTMTLYVHSLVLSIVFQAYIQESTTIYERSLCYREETLSLAFQCLQESDRADVGTHTVQAENIRKTLHLLRPHYSTFKVDALMEIVDPARTNAIDYTSFRVRIQQALSASVRAAPLPRNPISLFVEVLGAFVAIINFSYVILLSSLCQPSWFDTILLPAGYTITLLGLLELLARVNPWVLIRLSQTNKLNLIFDGLAALAAVVSCCGIVRRHIVVELMLTGRAIDLMRIMRFQRIARELIQRSREVLPTLLGPLGLVVSAHHIFVYIGMWLWGGAIHVGTYGDLIAPYYDLNNFNSYWEVSELLNWMCVIFGCDSRSSLTLCFRVSSLFFKFSSLMTGMQ